MTLHDDEETVSYQQDNNQNYGTNVKEEPLGSPEDALLQGDAIQNAPTRINSKKKKDHTYGSFVAYCFCVNYILGVGVLGRFII